MPGFGWLHIGEGKGEVRVDFVEGNRRRFQVGGVMKRDRDAGTYFSCLYASHGLLVHLQMKST
jgi:hypothetical protein